MSMKSTKNKSSSAITKQLNAGKIDFFPLNESVAPLKEIDRKNSQEFTIGVPRPELTNEWWTTFTSIPASENPLTVTNEGVIDDIQQPGEIHFLGGAFGASGKTEITREVTVAEDQSIVFPILTTGVDNVGWDFSDLPGNGLKGLYQFSIDDLKFIGDAIMDTAKGVSLEVNDELLISNGNKELYRQASFSPYTLALPAKDDILGYRTGYPSSWIQYPYTQGVQDGIWAELKDLPLGENTIHFTGTIDYDRIQVDDYNNSGGIGDTPLEALLQFLKDFYPSVSLNVTYNVDVLTRPAFNAQLMG